MKAHVGRDVHEDVVRPMHNSGQAICAPDGMVAAEALVHDLHMAESGRILGRTFLREWREASGMSLEALASEVGKSHATLSRIENRKSPYSQEILEAIAAVYGCQPHDLLSGPPADKANLRRSIQLQEAMRIFSELSAPRQDRMIADMIDSAALEGKPVPDAVRLGQDDPTPVKTG